MEHNQDLFADDHASLGQLVDRLDEIPATELTAKWPKALAEQRGLTRRRNQYELFWRPWRYDSQKLKTPLRRGITFGSDALA